MAALKKLTLSPNIIVEDLPLMVAMQEGFLAEEGIEAVLPHRSQRDNSDRDMFQRQKEYMFEQNQSQIYNACEWGCIVRSFESKRGGRIISKRCSITNIAIVVPKGSELHRPEDLAGRSIAISWNTGVHYMAYRMLEGFIPRDDINIVHVGDPPARHKALVEHDVDASILVEPYISLAEKHGARSIIEAYMVGEEVASQDLDQETIAAYLRALSKAVTKINEHPRKYAHILIEHEELAGKLTPEEVRIERLLYVEPQPYTREEFEASNRWMQERGMIGEGARFEDLVATAT